MIRRTKGSMTVEAAILLPLLILFFGSLMSLMSLVRTLVMLDSVTQAAVREMAVYAYPIDRIADIGAGLIDDADRILPEIWRFGLAEHALSARLEGTGISMERIEILAAEFPQGEEVYRRRKDSGRFDSYGEVFGPEDAYLALRYQPVWTGWIPGLEAGITLKAVERGWLKGHGALFAPRVSEKSIFEDEKEEETLYVYVTRTGIKYHREDCRYLRKSKIPMALKEAKVNYGACKVCAPPAG